MSMLRELFYYLPEVLPDNAYPGKAPTIKSLFPCVTYNFINSNRTKCNSFNSRSETFNVQISIFDNNSNCYDLIDLQSEIESDLINSVNLSSNPFIEVKKISSIGPRYVIGESYYQIIDTYSITLGEEK